MCASITENQVAWVDSQLPGWLCVFHLRIVACVRLSSGLSLGVPPPRAEINKDFWGAEHTTYDFRLIPHMCEERFGMQGRQDPFLSSFLFFPSEAAAERG